MAAGGEEEVALGWLLAEAAAARRGAESRTVAAHLPNTPELTAGLASPLPWSQHVPAEYSAFCYVYEGEGRIGDKAARPEHAYVLQNEGDTVCCAS